MTLKRYIIVDEPYATNGGHRSYLTPDDDSVPALGDVVTDVEDRPDFVDDEGDRLVKFKGGRWYINAGLLVDIDDVIRERATAKVEDDAPTPGAIFDANRTARPVTLSAKVIRPTVVAELLTDIGLDASTTEELVAIAVLRSADDGIPLPPLEAFRSRLSRIA